MKSGALFSQHSSCRMLCVMVGVAVTQAALADVSPELVARMAAEKEARRSCKVEICKAIAAPAVGAPIACNVTKTWTKDEILSKVVGGSYVWGYGHMQCKLSLNLDRGELGKVTAGGKANFPEHQVICIVDDADTTKGQAFDMKVSLTPAVSFENGDAKTVELQNVKTEGSSVASAAVSSILALDKVSGLVSRAAASEINTFVYSKCKDDGVEIVHK